MRAPEATWQQLDSVTQRRYLDCFKGLRRHRPAYNNRLLFRGLIEAFILTVEPESADNFIFTTVGRKIDEWYLGDGMYGDGPELALDNYNSYVIHPMYIEMLEAVENNRTPSTRWVSNIPSELAVKRMQRYNQFVERLISPEGTYPAFGRSVVYRPGVFQTLAMSAWKYGWPSGLTNGSVRSALTRVMENMFADPGNFTPTVISRWAMQVISPISPTAIPTTAASISPPRCLCLSAFRPTIPSGPIRPRSGHSNARGAASPSPSTAMCRSRGKDARRPR